jgi:hypothetical protein
VVDLDTALSEQLFDTTMGQPEAQVSADSDDDDIGQEPESGEGRAWRDRRPRAVSDSHDGSHRTRHTDVPRFVERTWPSTTRCSRPSTTSS